MSSSVPQNESMPEDVKHSAVGETQFDTSTEALKLAAMRQTADKQLSKWQTVKKYPYATYCCFVVIWMIILCSFENQAGSVVVSIPVFREDFGHAFTDEQGAISYVIETKWQSAFSGVPIAAAVAGQYFSSILAGRFGKKWFMICIVASSCAFVGIEFAATNVRTFLAGKTLNGFVIGALQTVGVAYVAEVAPLNIRGIVTSIFSISFSTGPLICYIINYAMADSVSSWAYKSIFVAQWGFAAVSLVLLFFITESPWYYILRQQPEKGEDCYRKLLKDPVAASEQFTVAMVTISESKDLEEGSSFIDCFRKKDRMRTLISTMPFFSQSMSGVYFTINFTSYYFQLTGYDTKGSFRLTIGAQICSIGGNMVAWFIIDRFGRRTNLLWGLTTQCVTNAIIGGAGTSKTDSAVTATVAFMVMYGFWYNLGVGTVAFPVVSENARSSLRTKTIAIALAVNNMFGMMWSFVLPYIFNPDRANWGAKTMFIFAGTTALLSIYTFFFQTETANRSFEEIDEMYDNHVPFRKFKEYETTVERLGKEQMDIAWDEKMQSVEHFEDSESLRN